MILSFFFFWRSLRSFDALAPARLTLRATFGCQACSFPAAKAAAIFLFLLFLANNTKAFSKNESTPPPEAAKILIIRANKEYAQRDFLAAEKDYAEALRIAPKNSDYLNRLASVKTRLGKPQEAEPLLRTSLQEQLENPTAWLLLGMNYLETNQNEKAFASLVQATLYDPKNARAQQYLGIAAERQHWNDISEASLRKAIELDPNYADAHFNLAVYYLHLTPPPLELVRRHYQRALDLGTPHDAKIDEVLK